MNRIMDTRFDFLTFTFIAVPLSTKGARGAMVARGAMGGWGP